MCSAQHGNHNDFLPGCLLSEMTTECAYLQVLASELLPPTVGDQALTDMLRSLPDSPETLDRVVAAVFASCPTAPASGLDAGEAAGAPLPLQVRLHTAMLLFGAGTLPGQWVVDLKSINMP